jgi:hypothetical protein
MSAGATAPRRKGFFSILGPKEVDDSYAEDVGDNEPGSDLDPGRDA